MTPTNLVIEASLGKMPTTLVRRLISQFSRSGGFVGTVEFFAVGEGAAVMYFDFVAGAGVGDLGAQQSGL